MSVEIIAIMLWSALGISAASTVAGLMTRRWWLMALAAALSFVFGLAAILSIGIFVLGLTALQIAGAIAFYRELRRTAAR